VRSVSTSVFLSVPCPYFSLTRNVNDFSFLRYSSPPACTSRNRPLDLLQLHNTSRNCHTYSDNTILFVIIFQIMSSSEDKMPGLVRARPLAEVVSTATQASRFGTDLLGLDKNTLISQHRQTPTTVPCDNTGVPLISVPSLPNRGPWGHRPKLVRRADRFDVVDWFAAEVHTNSVSAVMDGKYEDRENRHNTAARDFPTTSDAERTRLQGNSHSTRTGAASQSTLSPTYRPSRAQSASSFGSVDRRGNPGLRNYEAV